MFLISKAGGRTPQYPPVLSGVCAYLYANHFIGLKNTTPTPPRPHARLLLSARGLVRHRVEITSQLWLSNCLVQYTLVAIIIISHNNPAGGYLIPFILTGNSFSLDLSHTRSTAVESFVDFSSSHKGMILVLWCAQFHTLAQM